MVGREKCFLTDWQTRPTNEWHQFSRLLVGFVDRETLLNTECTFQIRSNQIWSVKSQPSLFPRQYILLEVHGEQIQRWYPVPRSEMTSPHRRYPEIGLKPNRFTVLLDCPPHPLVCVNRSWPDYVGAPYTILRLSQIELQVSIHPRDLDVGGANEENLQHYICSVWICHIPDWNLKIMQTSCAQRLVNNKDSFACLGIFCTPACVHQRNPERQVYPFFVKNNSHKTAMHLTNSLPGRRWTLCFASKKIQWKHKYFLD